MHAHKKWKDISQGDGQPSFCDRCYSMPNSGQHPEPSNNATLMYMPNCMYTVDSNRKRKPLVHNRTLPSSFRAKDVYQCPQPTFWNSFSQKAQSIFSQDGQWWLRNSLLCCAFAQRQQATAARSPNLVHTYTYTSTLLSVLGVCNYRHWSPRQVTSDRFGSSHDSVLLFLHNTPFCVHTRTCVHTSTYTQKVYQ